MFRDHKLFLCVAAALGALSAMPSASADPFLPVPPASFLNYHVSTARGLSEEVAQDVVVRARLARHFGMSEPALCEYVRQNLVETTLTASQAGRYRVACISPSGREYFVTEHLAAGTPVFALAGTGQPILRLACGNPLVAVLPVVPKPVVKIQPATLVTSPKTVATPVVSTPAVAVPTVAVATPMAVPQATTASPVVQVAGVTQSLHGGKAGAFVPALIGAAGVGVLTHHHDSPPPVTPPTAPVPEANSMALFGLFGFVMLGLQAKKRSKH